MWSPRRSGWSSCKLILLFVSLSIFCWAALAEKLPRCNFGSSWRWNGEVFSVRKCCCRLCSWRHETSCPCWFFFLFSLYGFIFGSRCLIIENQTGKKVPGLPYAIITLFIKRHGSNFDRPTSICNQQQLRHFAIFQWLLDFVCYWINQSIDQSIEVWHSYHTLLFSSDFWISCAIESINQAINH